MKHLIPKSGILLLVLLSLVACSTAPKPAPLVLSSAAAPQNPLPGLWVFAGDNPKYSSSIEFNSDMRYTATTVVLDPATGETVNKVSVEGGYTYTAGSIHFAPDAGREPETVGYELTDADTMQMTTPDGKDWTLHRQ